MPILLKHQLKTYTALVICFI